MTWSMKKTFLALKNEYEEIESILPLRRFFYYAGNGMPDIPLSLFSCVRSSLSDALWCMDV